MNKIFISYRRDDSAGYSGRLADRLVQAFGEPQVFRDYEDISPGQNFAEIIRRNLSAADVLLVVIGCSWSSVQDEQGRRLDNAEDFVRLEIETALQRGIEIIPILLNGAAMPKTTDLPDSLSPLLMRQAFELSDSRWEQDVTKLIAHLKPMVRPVGKARRLRRLAVLVGVPVLLATAILTAYAYFPADFSGQWYFERGDYLMISQQNRQVSIERIDPTSQTAYERGEGTVQGRNMIFTLEPVYSDRFKYRGKLTKSWNGENLSGDFAEILADQHFRVRLTRHLPHAISNTD